MSDMNKAKQFLRGYRNAKRNLQIIENQIAEIKDILGISGLSFDDVKVQTSTAPDNLANQIAMLSDLYSQAMYARDVVIQQLNIVTKAIDKIDNPLYRQILSDRYIAGNRWDIIAESAGYTCRQIFRIHGYALQEIDKIIQDVTKCH